MNRKPLPAVAAALALCVPLSAAPAAQAATMTMSGSTSIAPLATKLAKAFLAARQGKGNKVVILQGGSDIGITDVSRGRVTLGMSSRDPKPADPGGIVFNKFARDAVCVVTATPRTGSHSLSQAQIQDVFSGRVRSWSQVAGATANGPIDLVVRTAASGTQDAFQNIFMGQTLRVAGQRDDRSLQRPPGADDQVRPERDRLRLLRFTEGCTRFPTRGSRAPCATRSPDSTPAVVTSSSSAAAPPRAWRRSSSSSPAPRAGDRRQRLGAAALVPVGDPAAGRGAAAPDGRAPRAWAWAVGFWTDAGSSAARRGGLVWSCC